MVNLTKLQQIVREEFAKLQESGYLVPENEDLEVAIAIESASYNIASNILDIIEPDQYIRVNGRFYNKKAVLALKPKER